MTDQPTAQAKPRWKRHLHSFWRNWLKPIMVVLVIGCSFRSAVADWNVVPTGSMKPTILEGDRIFVDKLAYDLRFPFTSWRLADWSSPQRGDIVVFFAPPSGERYVKRIVGVPGDSISLRDNRVYVNGQPATYDRLDETIVESLEPSEQRRYRFAEEFIDGKAHPVMLSLREGSRRSTRPIVVPEDHFFVMGDNRDNSRDSRWFGCIPRGCIVGRTKSVLVSLNPDNHSLPRWDRFFHTLP